MGIKDRHQKLWLRRNAWLLAIATFVVMIYGVTIVRTTTWAHAFGVKQNEERASNSGQMVRDNNAMKKTMVVGKELDALRGEHAQAEAEKPMEETAENGREQLMKKEGEQETVVGVNIHDAHTAVTTGLRVHLVDKAENMVLPNDDTFSLDDSGHNLVDEAIANTVEGLVNTEKPKKDDKWTVIKTNSVADQTNDRDRRTDDAVKVPSTMDYKGPIPLTTLLTSTGNGSDQLRTGVDKLPGAEQAHNTMLPVSSGSAMMQNTQIQPSVFMSRRFDKSRLALKTSTISIPFEKRHHVLVGYNATMEYLQVYTKPADSQEELFLFFTCSNSKDDWTPNCARARKKVYDTFATSPSSTNRLVTIRAGPRDEWINGRNAFTNDDDLRLKAIPTLMRWDGSVSGSLRSTWGVLVDKSILYEPLLRYLFRNIDIHDKLLGKPEVETKEIVTLRGYAQYREYMSRYASDQTPYPMYLMMVSGRLQHNNRLWCPWCRQSEMPMEYAFYAYAPTNAKLIIVETYNKSSEWRNREENEFKKDHQLRIKGVPWFYRIYPGPSRESLFYQQVTKKFYVLEPLQQVFEESV